MLSTTCSSPSRPSAWQPALRKIKPRGDATRLEQVFIRDGERCRIVKLADIFLLESEGNYTRLCFGKERPLIARSLAALEERLDPATFFRADAGILSTCSGSRNVELGVAGNLVVKLRSGFSVEMSRRRRARLREVLAL